MMKSVEPTWSASSHTSWRALGVDDDDAVGVLGPERLDVLGPEALVHRAVALPQQEGGLLDVGLGRGRRARRRGFHTRMSSCGVAHGQAGVAAEVLVGEEQHLARRRRRPRPGPERPLEHGAGVGRRAHRAAVAADERLQRGRRVHVGDRARRASMSMTSAERLPRLLDLVEVGHVGHRAAGVEVGEDDLLVVAGEDVGRLGHEVHAAEHDVLGLGALLGEDRQPERVAPGVGPAHDLVALVVVAEDEDAGRRGRPWRRRSRVRARRARRRCSARGAVLEPQHVVGPPREGAPVRPVGTAWSPSTGMSSPERICRRIPGRRGRHVYGVPPAVAITNRGAATARRHDPRRARAPTSSRTPTAG